MKKLNFALTAVVLIFTSSALAGGDLIIRSISVIDGTGAPLRENVDVEIIGGRISRIGERLKSKVAAEIDGYGRYLIPGLIDAHTHLRSVPGIYFRNETSESVHAQQVLQLRSYLAAGVTTVLDAAAPASLLSEAQSTPLNERPSILGLGPFLTPENGYFASPEARGELYKDLWSPVHNSFEISDHIKNGKALGALGLKMAIEQGPFETLEVFDQPMRDAIRTEAKKQDVPIFVHSVTEKAHRMALTLRPYAFVHAGFADQPAGPEIVQDMKLSGAYVVTTSAVSKLMLLLWDHHDLYDPWLRNIVPSQQVETALDENVREAVIDELAIQMKPHWMPDFMAKYLSRQILNEEGIRTQLSYMQRSIRAMYKAGIPIVVGSDSGNWPILASYFHGIGAIYEMESLEEAGIPRMDILIAATSRAAKMLKIDGQVGTVSVGKAADLVILDRNPLESFSGFRHLSFVIKNGVAKSPRDWMQ